MVLYKISSLRTRPHASLQYDLEDPTVQYYILYLQRPNYFTQYALYTSIYTVANLSRTMLILTTYGNAGGLEVRPWLMTVRCKQGDR